MTPDIEHVVVLMLENRSFDCMLGKLYPSDGSFDGLTGQEHNIYMGQTVPVWASSTIDPKAAVIPDPDPGEHFTDMNVQLFGGPDVVAPAPMSGFAANYMTQPKADKPFISSSVMHYFKPEQVPVISTLAKAFGVCDQWYASAPCQTWPNRFFAHTGTALGNVDNSRFPIPFPADSIFRRLEDKGRTWRVYFHDAPQSLLLGDIWYMAPLRYRLFSQFLADAHVGALPNYSFIEPRYFTYPIVLAMANDEHPPHNVLHGEKLIAHVYNAVRNSPCWKKTLLVITFDEHGGCYDHMPPPSAVPPDGNVQDRFTFNRYGVRVPAVLISPYIPEGSKIRVAPEGLPAVGPPYPFDHTSILATLRKLFELGAPFSQRDAVAPDLLSALSLALPTNDGPGSVVPTVIGTTTTDTVEGAKKVPNHMQTNLTRMAVSLPQRAPAGASPQPAPMTDRSPNNVAIACADATAYIKSFLGI